MAENVDSTFLQFLRNRGVPEEYLLRMIEQHIDATIINFMDDGALSDFIPTYGDRVAARHFCLENEDFEVDPDALSNTSEVTFDAVHGEPMDGEPDDTFIYRPTIQFERDESGIRSVEHPSTSTAHFIPVSGDEVSTNSAPYETVWATIKLHRSNILEDMIRQFKDKTILRQTLTFCFIDERGVDQDGVSRDAYAAFWNEFMDRIADGEEVRVPTLPAKWDKEVWQSIGRILLKGFKDHGYFPCRLAPAFSVALIFGEREVSDEMLFDSFLLYISHPDRDLVTTALKADCVDEDSDELINLLHRLKVKLPTQENLKGILVKVAHYHFIQKPRYAAEHMSSTAGHILKESFCSPQAVLQMYEKKKPTTRRFLELLDASPTTQAENQSFRFLQRYIRGLDDAGLRRMLRFVTGSDVICVDEIEVMFTPARGLARRPIAHTCGPCLELPWTYASYSELCAEMDSILLNPNSLEFSIA